MDQQTRLFLWLLAWASGFALLGVFFGGITGFFAWREGRPAGTGVGLAVARAFARAARRSLAPGPTGALVGAADGLIFAAALGLLTGLILPNRGSGLWRQLAPVLLNGAGLVGGAVFFGLLARGMLRRGNASVVALFIGSLLGALAGFVLVGPSGLYPGTLLGGGLGLLLAIGGNGRLG